MRCVQTFKITETDRRAVVRLPVWSNERKPWVRTISVRPSVCDRVSATEMSAGFLLNLVEQNFFCKKLRNNCDSRTNWPSDSHTLLRAERRFTLLSAFRDRFGWNSVPISTPSHWVCMSFVIIRAGETVLYRRTWNYVYISVPWDRMIFWM